MNSFKVSNNKLVVIRYDIVPSTIRTYISVCIRTMDIVTGFITNHNFTISNNLYHIMNSTDDWLVFVNALCNDRERFLDSTIIPLDPIYPLITLELKYTWIS